TAEIAGDIGLGTVDGLANLATDAVRIDLLHVPAGLARLVGSAWQGGGGLSGLAAIFWEPGRGQVALAVDQAIDGDFRAAAASTVEAVGVGVATGVALGELGAAAVDAGAAVLEKKGEARGAGGGPRAGKPFTSAMKSEAWKSNEVKHGGQPTCETCSQPIVPARRSESGVRPPSNEGQLDHVVPRTRGGNGSLDNAEYLCRTCNRAKSDQ
ncbi:MAG: HNH endonuclease signature motif containing protein, partial [Byssovorax sp.]